MVPVKYWWGQSGLTSMLVSSEFGRCRATIPWASRINCRTPWGSGSWAQPPPPLQSLPGGGALPCRFKESAKLAFFLNFGILGAGVPWLGTQALDIHVSPPGSDTV